MKRMFPYLLAVLIIACNSAASVKNSGDDTVAGATGGKKDFMSALLDGKPFQSANKGNGLFNPLTKMSTVLGEDNEGRSISISFPPELKANETCTSCAAALFIKQAEDMTKTYRTVNITDLKIKLTVKNGSYVEGEFSFTASKALDDKIVVTNGKFASVIDGYEQ
ncbi:hypothetical protein [Ferruginibacter sp.]|nr:hypothetical protein [Ferruginibacter sp.]